jgi:hypothetical protein
MRAGRDKDAAVQLNNGAYAELISIGPELMQTQLVMPNYRRLVTATVLDPQATSPLQRHSHRS